MADSRLARLVRSPSSKGGRHELLERFGLAVAIDLIWIMGCPLLATEPETPPSVSLMQGLQDHPNDVVAMEKLADLYARNGWYEAAIGPLAHALELDPSRRGLWSALDTAVEKSGRGTITDDELIECAAAFLEAVGVRVTGPPTSTARRR